MREPIGKIKYYDFLVELYILNGYYIEMFYNIHSREVEELNSLRLHNDLPKSF